MSNSPPMHNKRPETKTQAPRGRQMVGIPGALHPLRSCAAPQLAAWAAPSPSAWLSTPKPPKTDAGYQAVLAFPNVAHERLGYCKSSCSKNIPRLLLSGCEMQFTKKKNLFDKPFQFPPQFFSNQVKIHQNPCHQGNLVKNLPNGIRSA